MLSATTNTLKPFFSSFTPNNGKLFSVNQPPFSSSVKYSVKPISAVLFPKPQQQQQQQLYQPFRPPPSPLPPKFRNLDTAGRLDVLANRLGLWFEYAPLIPALYQEGFSPPSIEEVTGITGVEQNRIIVAAQVRDSISQSKVDPEVLSFFDAGGAELLYEIRLLSTSQRAAAAWYLVQNSFDSKGAQDLARAIKDFPRRKGDSGWDKFNYVLPGDCLSFWYFRQSREYKNPSEERTSALKQALDAAESDDARNVVIRELEGDDDEKEDEKDEVVANVRVPVVRLKIGEVSAASSVMVLPVCLAKDGAKELAEAPSDCRNVGEFGVVVAEKEWQRWVVLPGWEPVLGLQEGGVVISFVDARVLPWKVNKWYWEEAILVVVDRRRKEVAEEDGFYLVEAAGDGGSGADRLKVERGSALKEKGVVESLGTVVLVVRPPREENDDQLNDEDWD